MSKFFTKVDGLKAGSEAVSDRLSVVTNHLVSLEKEFREGKEVKKIFPPHPPVSFGEKTDNLVIFPGGLPVKSSSDEDFKVMMGDRVYEIDRNYFDLIGNILSRYSRSN